MTKHTPLPDYLLEQLAQADLPPERLAQLRARLAQEPDGEQRLAALRASDEALRAALPAGGAGDVLRRAEQLRAPRRAPPWALALGTASLAALAALLVLHAGPPPGEVPEHTWPKGPGQLIVRRQTHGAPEQLSNGDAARPRDVLQLSYNAGDGHYGVILSIDGRGGVTLHFPESPGGSTLLAQREDTALANSFELDDAPGFERFFFVTSKQPLDVEAVLRAARTLAARPDEAARAPLALPGSLAQTSFLVSKVGR